MYKKKMFYTSSPAGFLQCQPSKNTHFASEVLKNSRIEVLGYHKLRRMNYGTTWKPALRFFWKRGPRKQAFRSMSNTACFYTSRPKARWRTAQRNAQRRRGRILEGVWKPLGHRFGRDRDEVIHHAVPTGGRRI